MLVGRRSAKAAIQMELNHCKEKSAMARMFVDETVTAATA
jgi:hypothetical protein